MIISRFLCLFFLTLPLFSSPPGGDRDDATASPPVEQSLPTALVPDETIAPHPDSPVPPPRVIIRVGRNQTLHGVVILEDDEVMAIRTPEGITETFAKRRVLRIIRLVDPTPGQRGIVILTNGHRRAGIIIEDAYDRVILEVKGIRATFRREIVDEVRLDPTLEEKYEHFKLSLAPGQHRAHLQLCQWLFDEQRYRLAKTELEELLKNAPLSEARRLLNIVNAQLELMVSGSTPKRRPPETSRSDHPREPAIKVLSNDDVNIIRVYEIDFDHPPRVTVPPGTIRSLLEQYRDNPLLPQSQVERTALFRAEPIHIVRLMFALRARNLYPDIKVNSEPPALNLFRLRVHDSWLMNNCATSRCHGGPAAGRLFLHRHRMHDPRARYANLLMLERFDRDEPWPLVNYSSPLDSLLIQYGLSRSEARKPHPEVPGWKPAFRGLGARMKKDAVRWIESMMQPRPDYPLSLAGPGSTTATSSPAPEKATANESQP